MAAHRDISGLLQTIRNFLLGRKFHNPLRFTDQVATRDYPAPVYPPESHEKLSKNYYFSRDARSEIRPPIELAGADVAKQLDDGTEKPAKPKNWPPIPGKPGNWDSHNFIKKY